MKSSNDTPPGHVRIRVYAESISADPNEKIPEDRFLFECFIKEEYFMKPMPEITIPESEETN